MNCKLVFKSVRLVNLHFIYSFISSHDFFFTPRILEAPTPLLAVNKYSFSFSRGWVLLGQFSQSKKQSGICVCLFAFAGLLGLNLIYPKVGFDEVLGYG